jgi:YHS domain-containing protein
MKVVSLIIGLLLAFPAFAQTSINVVGSDDKTAISGFDPVAFFTLKKAVVGDAKLTVVHQGAKWQFSTPENMQTFKQEPSKYVPAWGGHCAWAVSENGISAKKLSGGFEIIDGKLYLFSYGNRIKDGARDDFLYGRWSKDMRLRDGEKYWPELSRRLDEGTLAQPNASNYVRSRFE